MLINGLEYTVKKVTPQDAAKCIAIANLQGKKQAIEELKENEEVLKSFSIEKESFLKNWFIRNQYAMGILPESEIDKIVMENGIKFFELQWLKAKGAEKIPQTEYDVALNDTAEIIGVVYLYTNQVEELKNATIEERKNFFNACQSEGKITELAAAMGLGKQQPDQEKTGKKKK
jgi:hypothetical protein